MKSSSSKGLSSVGSLERHIHTPDGRRGTYAKEVAPLYVKAAITGFCCLEDLEKPFFPCLPATFLVEVTALNFLLGREDLFVEFVLNHFCPLTYAL